MSVEVTGQFEHDTGSAVLLIINGDETWLPWSQIEDAGGLHRAHKGDLVKVEISDWIADQKGIEDGEGADLLDYSPPEKISKPVKRGGITYNESAAGSERWENGFHRHGIKHLSASSINLWINSPDKWVAQYLFGLRREAGVAAKRGQLVEDAVSEILHGVEPNDAVERAHEKFDSHVLVPNSRTEKERDGLAGMIAQAHEALADFGEPAVPEGGGQWKIERPCKLNKSNASTIKFIGYLDFYFPEFNIVIDLKTSLQMKSYMPIEHQRQRALYLNAAPKGTAVKFLYVTPKKWGMRDDGDREAVLREIAWHTNRLENWLSRFSKEEIAELIPVKVEDNFYWNDCRSDAQDLYAYPDINLPTEAQKPEKQLKTAKG